MGVSCTKTQLLALLVKIEDDLMESCKREIDRERCTRILSPIRMWKARVQDLAIDEVVKHIF